MSIHDCDFLVEMSDLILITHHELCIQDNQKLHGLIVFK